MTNAAAQTVGVEDLSQLTGRFLTFALSQEHYGVGILNIQEVIGFANPTPVPQAPSYLRGVINLRGVVIPIIDLRQAFGLPSTTYNDRSCIIIIQPALSPTKTPVGVVVDRVIDVTSLTKEHMQGVPNFGVTLDTACLLSLARLGEQTIILVDMRKVIEKCRDAVICAAPLAQKKI
jgi:purine-binding chemotaxis protein CheW